MTVITRFAPSPTGSLHIGGARTALFNWLYAKSKRGLFKLRIEDTDLERSKKEYINQICESMKWLGLNWDSEIVYQSQNRIRHIDIIKILLEKGNAYKCYCTKQELEKEKQEAIKNKKPYKYSGKCRNLSSEKSGDFVVRIKVPKNMDAVLKDQILGTISIELNILDDFIILRSDKTPTYMLSVVVDDHDMKITDVIRGDDHLTNTFKQIIIYKLLNWQLPKFSHIPLIHGTDGTKLSKRHGALNVMNYKELGYLSEALNNYLLRLGWGYKDKEIFSMEEAISIFQLKNIGKSAARFDKNKLDFLNSHYIKSIDASKLSNLSNFEDLFKGEDENKVDALVKLFRDRADNLKSLEKGLTYMIKNDSIQLSNFAKELIEKTKPIIKSTITEELNKLEIWNSETIQELIKSVSVKFNVKMFDVAAPIRAAVTGEQFSPNIFKILEILGKNTVLNRLKKSFSN